MSARNILVACKRCSRGSSPLFSRSLATEVTSLNSDPTSFIPPAEKTRQNKITRPIMNTAIILNRSPIITRTPSLFERAYYAYQARIQRALHNPFPYEFYFKRGSPLETRFIAEELRRERKAFGKPFGIPVEDGDGKTTAPADDDPGLQEEDEESMPRIHPTDTKGDTRSLDRKGQRNLYLLVKTKQGGKDVWAFPQGDVAKGELLHEAATRDLTAVCGPYMDTWIVSRQPIGVYNPPPSETSDESSQSFTFFYKAHILAGQVRADGKPVLDFAWLTKEEMEPRLGKDYWLGVKDMLSDF